MPSGKPADVLVIGAGPVGLTLACELRRHGIGVRLVEKRDQPQPHPNAAIVHVRTLEILSAMGAVDGFLREGYAFPGLHVRAFGRRLGFVDTAGVDSPYPLPRTLGQHVSERLLREHFARLGGLIEWSVEAAGLEQDPRQARVRLRHLAEKDREEIVAVPWVVGCEGSSSMTRQAAAIPFSGERYSGKEFLQMDAYLRWSHPHGFGYQFITAEHVLICFAYNDRGLYRIICARNDQNPTYHEPPTLAEMEKLVREITSDPSVEVYDATWFNRFRTGYRLAARFREGRAFVAGDAGHVHIPIGGQGMNYGMHDAFNLAWKLAAVIRNEARPALLDTYTAERHPVDEALVRGTDRGFHFLVQAPAFAGTAMRLLGPLALGFEPIRKRIRDTLAEMNVAYPASDLSEDHSGSAGPAAGDRAPDTLVRLPEGKTTRLFEVLQGTRWTLLLFAGLDPAAEDLETLQQTGAAITATYGTRVAVYLVSCHDPRLLIPAGGAVQLLLDTEEILHARYGVDTAPCLYLIRPDWHVAFRGGAEHHSRLINYLQRIFT